MASRFMTAPQDLRTARLLLRSFESEDVVAIVRLAGAKPNRRHDGADSASLRGRRCTEFPRQSRRRFSRGAFRHLCDIDLPGRELCGAVGLQIADAHRHAELGYWIGVPFWGKGYATEAASAAVAFGFDMLRLNRIYAHHFAGNTASQRVLEKIGMRHEGRFPATHPEMGSVCRCGKLWPACRGISRRRAHS